MAVELTLYELRVIGCLLEKEITTPDQYPLSLNALVNACNQKSNRDPVLDLSEATVQDTLDALIKKRLVTDKTGFGGRVAKYQHRFCNTEFGTLQFSEQELGILCVLFLRGPQTPGELRVRTNRLCRFGDTQEVESALEGLMSREDGPFVTKLAREPGKREARFAHLFTDEPPATSVPSADAPPPPTDPLEASDRQRLAALEHTVAELSRELAELKRRLD